VPDVNASAGADGSEWDRVLTAVLEAAHLVSGDDLSAMLDEAVRPVGLSAEVLLSDLDQRQLTPVQPRAAPPAAIDGTVAGRVYQLGEILPATDAHGDRLLWVPMVDGTERIGVIRFGLGPPVRDDLALRQRLWLLAGLMGHVLVSKLAASDRLKQLRTGARLTIATELLWQMLPPRTVATEQFVATALLEPSAQVAGDAYDFSVDTGRVAFAVFDGVGHDITAMRSTTLALAAIRNARRAGETDLIALAAEADRVLLRHGDRRQFVTAALADLTTSTGRLRFLLAGHPAPLLFRDGRFVTELKHPPRPPLGIDLTSRTARATVREVQLQPGDRLLLYSDGVTEARDANRTFFGEKRLIDLTERAHLDRLPAPETLRRLTKAVLAHQDGALQDDLTLLLLDWSTAEVSNLMPSLHATSEVSRRCHGSQPAPD
jgi:serine phosphatase RsbU (regulator of sigma subunit)